VRTSDERTERDRYSAVRIVSATAITAALLLLRDGLMTAGQAAANRPDPGTKNSIASIWKSETTGNEYRVHIEGDTFHADWANVPPELARRGAYVRTECKRVGSRWVGTTRSLLPCTQGSGASAKILNWCPLVTRTEIDSVAAGRITGRAQAIHKSDCQSCKLLETVWKDFVWTPKH
jgi:hypothetical protein